MLTSLPCLIVGGLITLGVGGGGGEEGDTDHNVFKSVCVCVCVCVGGGGGLKVAKSLLSFMQKISGNLMVKRIIVVQGVGSVSTPFKWVLKTYRHNP